MNTEAAIPEIPLPYRHRVRAAEGWLMLGDAVEALAELDRLPDGFRQRQEVLSLHWSACTALKRWDEAWSVANAQWTLHPEVVESWIHRSYAARRHSGGSVAKAFGLLEPAIIVSLILIIGIIALSVFLPMTSMLNMTKA